MVKNEYPLENDAFKKIDCEFQVQNVIKNLHETIIFQFTIQRPCQQF